MLELFPTPKFCPKKVLFKQSSMKCFPVLSFVCGGESVKHC